MAAKHAEEVGPSLCAPISAQSREWSDESGEHFITTRYYTVGIDPEETLCTVAEARTFEHAMNDAWNQKSDAAVEAAVKDAEKLARAMVSGQKYSVIAGKPLCG